MAGSRSLIAEMSENCTTLRWACNDSSVEDGNNLQLRTYHFMVGCFVQGPQDDAGNRVSMLFCQYE